MVAVQLVYASLHHMQPIETIPLVLTAVLAAIPVALPATFTLASAVAARTLAKLGVLPTRLSAIDEAATLVRLEGYRTTEVPGEVDAERLVPLRKAMRHSTGV